MIDLIGIGMGSRECLTLEALHAIARADCLIGAGRLVDCFSDLPVQKERCLPSQIVPFIKEHPEFENVAVLLSGDAGFYSAATKLRGELLERESRTICGISSLQYFCARLGIPWQDVAVLSLHGREGHLLGTVAKNRRTFLLAGGELTAEKICRTLVCQGVGELRVHIGERLSYPDERISSGSARELAAGEYAPLSVLLVENGNPARSRLPGIPDGEFLRGPVPMTKSEVRAVILSKLAPGAEETVYDVGSGTGSVAIELALSTTGCVYAIEREPDALGLMEQNRRCFGVYHMQCVPGTAPAAFSGLPAPDCAFVGGSGGNLREIILALYEKNPAARLVISAVTLETLGEATRVLADLRREAEVVGLSVTRTRRAGGYHLLDAQNPVFLIRAGGVQNES
ncbi:precorrin-6y C5,15-methyltransferase (decarboxylating) subunit CbiE [Harryflintia acetispora]|uniref:Precorrin-6Y C5,15-methyltransferase (Decarboxylating) n=1 Tax=Harryflintia acetispora TaxID=1849041 RepID=A0A9X8Y7H7_9FIRM|nr:precorrin-6y C5,15-methyltransferase (decarboxylating) subunit CbiE [Harryflintia acetispora]TCL42299.1 precorrin-6Y C5,15-methyltransferase (decarboxylating) [Harryflintia acetispora]